MRRVSIVLAILSVAAAAATIVWALAYRDGSGEPGVNAIETPSAQAACGSPTPAVAIADKHFAAFIRGSSLTSKKGKFLIVQYALEGGAQADASSLAHRFVLVAPSGDRFSSMATVLTSTTPTAPVPAGQAEIVFDVPLSLSAATLIYDDGCTHEEWVAP